MSVKAKKMKKTDKAGKKTSRPPTTGIRAPEELLARADAYRDKLNSESPGANYSRHSVILMVLDQNLPKLQASETTERA